MDTEVKRQFDDFCSNVGMNATTAFNMFARAVLREKRLPFELTYHKPNDMLRASFEEAEALLADPNIKGYATVEELNAAMNAEDARDGGNV